MRRYVGLLAGLIALALLLCACSGGDNKAASVDYEDAATFEAALNAGENLAGKVVRFKVNKLVPDSAFGYNLQAGENLNFCSATNPGVNVGDTVTVAIKEVTSMLGSYIITYDKR